MRKKVGIIKRLFSLLLIFLLSINSFAAIVSDNDGSAFITKAEFDALKSSFQSQIDSYNQSIDSKIDGAIASYLAGIKLSTTEEIKPADFAQGFCMFFNNTDYGKIGSWDCGWKYDSFVVTQNYDGSTTSNPWSGGSARMNCIQQGFKYRNALSNVQKNNIYLITGNNFNGYSDDFKAYITMSSPRVQSRAVNEMSGVDPNAVLAMFCANSSGFVGGISNNTSYDGVTIKNLNETKWFMNMWNAGKNDYSDLTSKSNGSITRGEYWKQEINTISLEQTYSYKYKLLMVDEGVGQTTTRFAELPSSADTWLINLSSPWTITEYDTPDDFASSKYLIINGALKQSGTYAGSVAVLRKSGQLWSAKGNYIDADNPARGKIALPVPPTPSKTISNLINENAIPATNTSITYNRKLTDGLLLYEFKKPGTCEFDLDFTGQPKNLYFAISESPFTANDITSSVSLTNVEFYVDNVKQTTNRKLLTASSHKIKIDIKNPCAIFYKVAFNPSDDYDGVGVFKIPQTMTFTSID